MADEVAEPPITHATLVIKTPTSNADAGGDVFRMSVPLAGTVRQIKEQLMREHPEHPPPPTQRLIFAGRLLQDSTPTSEVLRQVSARVPLFHPQMRGASPSLVHWVQHVHARPRSHPARFRLPRVCV